MALDHAALLEVLETMKSAGVDERIKLAATTTYQALIDAELTAGGRRRSVGTQPGSVRFAERVSTQVVVDGGWGFGVVDPEVAVGVVLPVRAGTPLAG